MDKAAQVVGLLRKLRALQPEMAEQARLELVANGMIPPGLKLDALDSVAAALASDVKLPAPPPPPPPRRLHTASHMEMDATHREEANEPSHCESDAARPSERTRPTSWRQMQQATSIETEHRMPLRTTILPAIADDGTDFTRAFVRRGIVDKLAAQLSLI